MHTSWAVQRSGSDVSVLVVGGGLAGCTAALELEAAGADVVVLDAGPSLMQGASRFNEGKVHLGYVYANDDSERTLRLMLAGAMEFAAILDRHLPVPLRGLPVSPPFDYAVHPATMVPPSDLARRYRRIETEMERLGVHGAHDDYLGLERVRQLRRCATDEQLPPALGADACIAAFATEERAVEPFAVADGVIAAVERSRIDVRCSVVVDAVERINGRYWAVTALGRIGPFDSVINASWASRDRLDRTVGIVSTDPWSYRFKYFLRVRKDGLGDIIPTVTWALGPFGDVLTYGADTAYLSWYPAGRVSFATSEAPPPTVSPRPDRDTAAAVTADILAGLAQLVPAIASIDPVHDDVEIWGGVIVGVGATDIDDPDSGLHRRDNIGIVSVGDYHSISTGKWTTAPMLGRRAAEVVLYGVAP